MFSGKRWVLEADFKAAREEECWREQGIDCCRVIVFDRRRRAEQN